MIIRGKDLYAYLISGARNVIVNEMALNKINVFPVPDGDTGTNLCLTMNRVIDTSEQIDNVSQQIDSIARIAIDNAYGNSGMIFAQYLNGLSVAFKDKKFLMPQDLIEGFQIAFKHAYESVAHPKEGTILSVMRSWGNSFEGKIHDHFDHGFELNLKELKKAVEETKFQLKVLKDNNVVDAGAMGFFYFMEGMLTYIKSGKLDDLDFKASTLDWISEPTNSVDIGEYRYCTQFLIQTDFMPKEIQKKLEVYGDSLIVNQKGNNVSIHLHSNEPDKVMQELIKSGVVLSHKVDDMYIQTQMIHKPISKIAILCDSIADLPQDMIDENQIVVLPLNIIVDSVVYMDKITMKPDNFYQHMDDYRLNPSSSQATLPAIERILNQVLSNYNEVIGLFVSSKMSGTYSNVIKTLDKMKTEGKKIKIIDTMTNSVAEGLIVQEAIKARSKGLDFDQVVKHIEESIKNTKIFVSVKDLKYMIKGGRVSKVSGMVLSRLKLQPVISIDKEGKGSIPFKSLSQKNAVKSIIKALKKDMIEKGIQNYALVYADNIDNLTQFKEECIKVLGKEPDYIETISAIVGLNAGKGSFAIAYITKRL